MMVVHVARSRESLEQQRLLVHGDADSRIADAYLREFGLAIHLNRDSDRPTIRAVLDGVAQQVPEHLFQAQSVGLQ